MSKRLNLGLIGWPLGHSLSPPIHQAALEALQIHGEYKLYPCKTDDDGHHQIGALMEMLRSGSLNGMNVTIPYKQVVMPFMNELTSTAAAIGAVNTIIPRSNRLIGENTDAGGFLADLENQFSLSQERSRRLALVLGAGGSARAVVYGLARANWRVVVAARRIEQARSLAADMDSTAAGSPVEPMLLDRSILSERPEPDLIVNTTPVGMSPNINVSPWPEDLPLPGKACLYDLVYNPSETQLMKQARQAGLRIANGLGMLVEQAALALEHWTNLSVPRTPMRLAALQAAESFIRK